MLNPVSSCGLISILRRLFAVTSNKWYQSRGFKLEFRDGVDEV